LESQLVLNLLQFLGREALKRAQSHNDYGCFVRSVVAGGEDHLATLVLVVAAGIGFVKEAQEIVNCQVAKAAIGCWKLGYVARTGR
jgi:hypothetical protein